MESPFADLATDGPLVVAAGVAALAGLVSFLSPCVLPLVPGYLSYVTGLAGAELDADRAAARGPGPTGGGAVAVAVAPARPAVRGRVLAGTLLFVAGFTAVWVCVAILFASVGKVLYEHARALEVVGGSLIIVLGLAFLGLVPGLRGQWRMTRLPAAGLLGAPVFGAVFALSWVPCATPTLGAVLLLATVGGQTDRAVLLAVAYCLGLGVPFVAFGLAFRRLLGVFAAVRRNSRWVTRVGGALLLIVGLALVTGGWTDFTNWLRATVGVGEVGI
ncbi:MAG TPA: cytochrome c biogenesis protein CcdA [Pilimelia sp.]|nr:cytochrome c biogenesis protein CcdA [Pilimelia sp.]